MIGAIGNLAGVLGWRPRPAEPEVRVVAGPVEVRISVPDGLEPEAVLRHLPSMRDLLPPRRRRRGR